MNDAELLNPAAVIGDNKPPATLTDELQVRYKNMLDEFMELTASANTVPDKIADDETHKSVLELVKKMRTLSGDATAKKEAERKPWGDKYDQVNGFFNARLVPFDELRKKINERHEAYAKNKAAAEKRRLEEEAEKRRLAEQEALAAAQEAQRTRLNAEAGQRESERLAEFARDARNAATSDVQIAAAELAEIKADEGRILARLLGVDADFARKRQAKEPWTEAERVEAKREDTAALVAAKARKSAAEDKLRLAREAEAQAKRDQAEAERQANEKKREAAAAGRDERQHFGTALREDARATRLEEKAGGPEADLARVYSEHGAVGTLSQRWTCRVVDRNKLDKAALWPFINADAIDAALWKWMMAQAIEKRSMPGAVMEKETEGQVR